MASKTPKATDAAKAAQLNKALDAKGAQASGKKKLLDPARDPSTYSADELMQMVENGEIPRVTQDMVRKFALGEITWAELTGLTMQDAYSFAEIAYNLFEQGKYDQAQTIVEGLVISNPYDGYFHSLLGSIYGRKGMHEEALEEYSVSLELDDKNLPAYVNRAEIQLQHGEIEKALQDLKAAIDLDPKGETPFGIRARALAHATASILEEAMRDKGIDPSKYNKPGSKADTPAKKPAPKK